MRFGSIVAVFVMLLASCGRESADWESAQRADTKEAYGDYVRKHSDGKHTGSAAAKIDSMEWREANVANTPDSYDTYIRKHPSGKYAGPARDSVETILWSCFRKEKTLSNCSAYLERFPKGKYADSLSLDFSREWLEPDTSRLKLAGAISGGAIASGSIDLTYKGAETTQRTKSGIWITVPDKEKGGIKSKGVFKSKLGRLQATAAYSEDQWTYIADSEDRENAIGWGRCIVNGEIIVPLSAFESKGASALYVENRFELKMINDKNAIIIIDPARGHKVCAPDNILDNHDVVSILVNCPGSEMQTSHGTFVRNSSGWTLKPRS
jgi:hypothetical protein